MNDHVARALQVMPLVGILRHIGLNRVEPVGAALIEAGFTVAEVPLNDEGTALACIEQLTVSFGPTLVVGAGTVTDVQQVRRVAEAGGQLIVSPDTNPDVIAETVRLGLTACPGAATPSEAFAALRAGADVIKLFPACVCGPSGLRALGDVLPASARIFPVGGVSPTNVASWRAAGAAGLGIGGALYRPGSSPADVHTAALAFVAAWNESDSA